MSLRGKVPPFRSDLPVRSNPWEHRDCCGWFPLRLPPPGTLWRLLSGKRPCNELTLWSDLEPNPNLTEKTGMVHIYHPVCDRPEFLFIPRSAR